MKAEFFNFGLSIKDRVALATIEGAAQNGRLNESSIIAEPSSRNTGKRFIIFQFTKKGYKGQFIP